jgi:hypothetical protein
MAEFPLFYCPFTLDETVVAGRERIKGAPYSTDESATLVRGIQLALAELSFRAASGENQAIEGLLNIATKATHALTNLAHNEPELLAPLVAHDPGLPVLAHLRTERTPQTLELLKSLKVGSGLANPPSSKSRQSPDHTLTKYARGLALTLELNQVLLRKRHEAIAGGDEKRRAFEKELTVWRKQFPTLYKKVAVLPPWVEELGSLPEFSGTSVAENWKAFWDIAKQALLDEHPRPEKIPELAALLPNKAVVDMTPAEQKARILERLGRVFRTYCSRNA